MIEQMIIPQAVIQVAHEIPCEHHQHTQQELAIVKRQCENLTQAHLRILCMRFLLCTRLQTDVEQHQQEGEIAEKQYQRVLFGRIGKRINQNAAEKQHRARCNR